MTHKPTIAKDLEYTLVTDSQSINVDAVFEMISRSYWASARTKEGLKQAIDNSVCIAIEYGGNQIAFARVVTDYTYFGYLFDVIVHEDYRRKGLGKKLMEAILSHPSLKNLKHIGLATVDAQGFYEQFGFTTLPKPEWHMQLRSQTKVTNLDNVTERKERNCE